MREKKDFFDVPMTSFASSIGELKLPVLYKDASTFMMHFWVDPKRLTETEEGKKLFPKNMKPCKFFNGKALVTMAFFLYRDSTLGPYNEVSLTTAVIPDGMKKPLFYLPQFLKKGKNWKIGSFFQDLPVTTEMAYVGGREIWNYPKFVTGIDFDLGKNNFEGSVKDPKKKKDIVSVSGTFKKNFSVKGIDLNLFSNHNGYLLKTVTDVKSKWAISLKPNVKVTIGDSTHSMAKNLHTLGLADKKPFVIAYSHDFKSRLHDGQKICKV